MFCRTAAKEWNFILEKWLRQTIRIGKDQRSPNYGPGAGFGPLLAYICPFRHYFTN